MKTIETRNGSFAAIDEGDGPVVLLLHGWPESAYSWRHQIPALAQAGYRVVAPNQRGYAGSFAPEAVDAYTQLHLVGDAIALLDALEAETAVVIGHDWGAPVAWHTALMRPDRVRAVAGLSVPYTPRGARSLTQAMRDHGHSGFYMLYFQEPGVAEAELEADIRDSLLRIYYVGSGNVAPGGEWIAIVPPGGGVLDTAPPRDHLPPWLTEADLDHYTAEFRRSGFRGPLNWYRNVDLSWELMAAYHDAPLEVPACFIAGERDMVLQVRGLEKIRQDLAAKVPDLHGPHFLHGAGHWTQQERPEEVNRILLDFLGGLPR
ncbi:alpha/beta fold hydrolase [Marinibaculum pumilum]|uniref:Alpha/beta fold hydrolase n=1 Tax=Marinibaculum pumilum TaxID=1766165 RepID=A0ABV7KW13_9PROT